MLYVRSVDLIHLTAESLYLFANLSPLPNPLEITFLLCFCELNFLKKFISHMSDIPGLLKWSVVKNPPANAGDTEDVGLIPG